MTTCKQLIQKIKSAKNIAIFAHRDPDPDACGASLALRDFCRELGKNAESFCEHYSEYVENIFPMKEFKSKFLAKDYDLVAFVDMHTENRLEPGFVEEIKKCKNVIVIDHHVLTEMEVVPTKIFRIVKKASASQLVLDLFREVDKAPALETATYLYAGLVGDTDRFLYLATEGDVFSDAKYLLECGVDFVDVYNKMFRTISHKEIILSKYLYSNIKYLADGKIVYIIFGKKTLNKLGATVDDVKIFSNSLLNIKGAKWSLLIYETEKNNFRFSMRSVPEINLVPLANSMNGGGHKNASAFSTNIKKCQIKNAIKSWSNGVLNG